MILLQILVANNATEFTGFVLVKLSSVPTILTQTDKSGFVTQADKYTPREWSTVFNIFP